MREVKPGGVYRHFKGKMYQVVDVAFHSETLEEYVVYRQLYGEEKTWVRPLAMFLEPVDRVKYPDCEQEFRFELTGEE
ncbi:MAG: DUF1653 domain-containing protein [Clostridia bacterium]|nr:DUF1653 domain-containing protein [Clostridia bacterium]